MGKTWGINLDSFYSKIIHLRLHTYPFPQRGFPERKYY